MFEFSFTQFWEMTISSASASKYTAYNAIVDR